MGEGLATPFFICINIVPLHEFHTNSLQLLFAEGSWENISNSVNLVIRSAVLPDVSESSCFEVASSLSIHVVVSSFFLLRADVKLSCETHKVYLQTIRSGTFMYTWNSYVVLGTPGLTSW